MIITSPCYKLAEEIQKLIRKKFEFKVEKLIISECETESRKNDIRFVFSGKPNLAGLHNPSYRTFGYFSDSFLRRKFWTLDSKVIGSVFIDKSECNFVFDNKSRLCIYRVPIESFARESNTPIARNCLIFPTLRRPQGCKYFKSAQSVILNGNYIEVGYEDLDQMTETYLDINIIYSKKIEEENE